MIRIGSGKRDYPWATCGELSFFVNEIYQNTILGKLVILSGLINGYTFRGTELSNFIIASLFHADQLLKERICSQRSKFFPLRVDPFLKRLRCQGKHTGNHESCFSL